MENELPARLAFLIPLILQCTGKSPSSFIFVQKLPWQRELSCVILGGSQLQNVQAQAKRQKAWREAAGTPGPTGFGKRKKNGQNKSKSPFCASRTTSREKSSLLPVGASSSHWHTGGNSLCRFYRAAPSAHSGDKDLLCARDTDPVPPSVTAWEPGLGDCPELHWDLRAPSSSAVPDWEHQGS